MRTLVLVSAVAVLALGGCANHTTRDHRAVDDYCERCAIYVGDYSGPDEAPPLDPATQEAMLRMEAKGDHEHIANMAALIVRRARSDPNTAFSPGVNAADKHFQRWVETYLQQTNPWGMPATVRQVALWIQANRQRLPESELLSQELMMFQQTR